MADNLRQLTMEARRALHVWTHPAFARFLGVSTRTVQRHALQGGISAGHQHRIVLAALVHKDPALARRYAAAAKLNYAEFAGAAVQSSPRRPPAREDALHLISEAADALNQPPRAVKPVLAALFAQADAQGIDLNRLSGLLAAEAKGKK